jgi:esterase/lipase superfamily enzyme
MLAASTLVLGLIVVVALLAYAFAWRATSGRSLGARALVRGVIPLLMVAVPALTFTMMKHDEAPRELGKIGGSLSSSPSIYEPAGPTKLAPVAPHASESSGSRSKRLVDEMLEAARAREAAQQQEAQQHQDAAKAPERHDEQEYANKTAPGEGYKSGEVIEPGMSTLGEQPFGGPQLPNARSAAPQAAAPAAPASPDQPRIVMPPAPPQAAATPTAPASPDSAADTAHGGTPPSPVEPESKKVATLDTPSDVPQSPPVEPTAPPVSDAGYDVVPVFFGTDREEEPNPKRLTFNAERGRRLQLGRALVTVPKIHEVPQIERPWALRIGYFDLTIYEQAEDPKKHFTMQELKKLSKEELLQLVRERLGASQRFKDHAIVFVHGYNTSFDHAVYRSAQISYDLKFDGAAFLYSWPSGGAVASYTYDRESAEGSAPYLRQFLEMVVKETGAKSISIIGHSMGNQPLLDVLKDMKSAAPAGVVISQVILAAPDVDADNFTNLAQRIEGLAQGVTLYAASNDRALIVSRNFWRNPRAGDVLAAGPLIVPGMDTIDVTALSTDTFALNHSGYAENNVVLQDIGKLIENGLRPPDQRLSNLRKITTARGDYWRYTVP